MAKVFRWIDYVLLGIIYLYLLVLSSSLPLNYDESYNLQVPLTLLREQKYDTIYHSRSFDGFTTITTGPTVLIPTFFVFKVFGVGLLRARIVQYFYVIALVGLIWSQIVKHSNRIIAFGILLIFYSIPTQLYLGLSVLGELPAIFFVFLGLTLWGYGSGKYQKISVFIMGLSVITKLYFGLVLFPLLALLTVRAVQSKESPRNFIEELLTTAPFFLLPLILWESTKLLYLGYTSYVSYLSELRQFVAFQQIDFGLAPAQFFGAGLDKFTVFSQGIFPGFPEWVVWVLVSCVTLTSLRKILQGVKDDNIVFSLSFLIFATFFLWFLFISSSGWWRHIYPFSILFLILLDDFIRSVVEYFRNPIIRYVAITILCVPFVLYVVPSVINQYKYTLTFSNSLSSQREFANEVRLYRERGFRIGVDGWWQAPEISFLSGVDFFPFTCEQEYRRKHVVIYTALEEALAQAQANALKACLGEKIFESADQAYSLYRIIK